ncbi:MAG TPA: hypothetical protein VJB65_00900, partial [Patescibacteria group bacterium]|nr:hypothetical protein [Patescibacteria group bacterium]
MMNFFLGLDTTILMALYIAGSALFFLIALFFLRFFLSRSLRKPDAFHMSVLRIVLPKEGQEDEQKSASLSAEQIKEKISVAEVFFATMGGVKAQRGLKAFLFGRNDHFSLEIVADKEGLVTFFAAVPRYLKQYFEQQIHAQYETAEIVEVEDYNIFEPTGITVGSTLTLEKSYIYSVHAYDKMESDPLNSLTNVMSKFEKNEGAAVQFVLRSAKREWHRLPM